MSIKAVNRSGGKRPLPMDNHPAATLTVALGGTMKATDNRSSDPHAVSIPKIPNR